MVVSNIQSNLSSASSSLYLSLENLSISSVTEEDLGLIDDDIVFENQSPVESEEEFYEAYKSPFYVCHAKDGVPPSCACTKEHGRGTGDSFADANTSEESSDFDRPWQSPLTNRESLLEEAWERKRELYLQAELVNFNEHASIRKLGRSASDCGKPTEDICVYAKHELLERSMSDCSNPKKDPLFTPNSLIRTRTRSLTDDDFEELKGCLDLGFRFDQSSIPDLCDTLPALEAVCAVTHSFQESLMAAPAQSSTPSPTPSWRITSPGDDPEEVREKLRHWAQAVACSARLCY